MVRDPCPKCLREMPFWGGTICLSCGWHVRGMTIHHADFSADPACQWCIEVAADLPF